MNRLKSFLKYCFILLVCPVLTACNKEDKYTPLVYSWDDAVVYEAEDGECLGNTFVNSEQTGYSGQGYVEGFVDEYDGLRLVINIEETGFYDLDFVSASTGASYKENYIFIDGNKQGTVSVESIDFTDSYLERVYFESGSHEIIVYKYWGWILLDKLSIKKSDELDPNMFKVDKTLSNPDADDNAKRLFSFLCDNYGNHIISGQVSDGMYGSENAAIWAETGEYPAILGLDFVDYSLSRVEKGCEGYSTDYAISYWNSGGIVEFSWLWNAPAKYITGDWEYGYYTDSTNIDLEKIFSGEDEEGLNLLMEDIDAIAEQLKILSDNGVPVLFRPLQEGASGIYWWGASGSEAYKELYILLYNTFTNTYKLNNIIWIWNGRDAEWYPGDEYVDIIAWNVNDGEKIYSSHSDMFLEAVACSDSYKMVVMMDNGCLFDSDLAFRDGSPWGFFCTMGGEYILSPDDTDKYSEQYTELYMLIKVYADDRVINRSDLPDLTTYAIK